MALWSDLIWPEWLAFSAVAEIGGHLCARCQTEIRRADPEEILVLGLLLSPAMAALFYLVTFLGASPWKSLRPLSATSGGNSRSVDQMTAAHRCRFPFRDVILGGVHGLEGPVDGFFGGAVLHLTH